MVSVRTIWATASEYSIVAPLSSALIASRGLNVRNLLGQIVRYYRNAGGRQVIASVVDCDQDSHKRDSQVSHVHIQCYGDTVHP